jgi:hypothetical protein
MAVSAVDARVLWIDGHPSRTAVDILEGRDGKDAKKA